MRLWCVVLVVIGLLFAGALIAHGAVGAIWTTLNNCGTPEQDINHYYVGEIVYINGSNFVAGIYDWAITGQPGGASCDPKITVASGTVTITNVSGVWSCEVQYDPGTDPPLLGAECLTCAQFDPTCTLDGTFCFPAYTVQPDDCGEYTVDVGKKNDNYGVVGFPITLTVSGLTDLLITQPKLEQWFGGTYQSLGTLTVAVEARLDYEITAYCTVTPTPVPAFDGDPLRFEYPAGGGTWTVLPEWPGSVDLPGFSGSPNDPSGEEIDYPVQINLLELGDREGGETFTFTIHVVLSEL